MSSEGEIQISTNTEDIITQIRDELPEIDFSMSQVSDPWRFLSSSFIIEDAEIVGISLNKQEIHDIPDVLNDIPNLKELYLSGTNLTSFPNNLNNYSNLEHLFTPSLEEFPQVILEMKNLHRLTMNNGSITEIPDLTPLKSLNSLFLSRNQVNFNDDFIDKIHKLKNLEVLALNENNISQFPENISKLSNTKIRSLGMGNNQITSLPVDIIHKLARIPTLQRIDLSENKIDQLPAEIIELTQLEEINFEENEFKEKPPEISKLKEIGIKVKFKLKEESSLGLFF